MSKDAGDFALNISYLMQRQFGRRDVSAFANQVQIDRSEMSRLLNSKKTPSRLQIYKIEAAFDMLGEDLLMLPHPDFISKIAGGIRNKIQLPVPDCIRSNWSSTIVNFSFLKGDYIIYYYSQRYGAVVGCQFAISALDVEGIRAQYTVEHLVERGGAGTSRGANVTFEARLYCVADLMYFYSSPQNGAGALGFGVFAYHNAAGNPFAGELLLVQPVNTKDGLRDYPVHSKGMLYPVPRFSERESNLRQQWIRRRVGPLRNGPPDSRVAEFFRTPSDDATE